MCTELQCVQQYWPSAQNYDWSGNVKWDELRHLKKLMKTKKKEIERKIETEVSTHT